ncbi:MAG: methyl-accepting chemotaxis protein, partial [Bacteroidales bacterium]|nr:methyl-accepting chemotaxis protein [Bacteroidales bacterium]
GFAVVASEVRKLAERSKVAAEEIVSLANNSYKITESAGSLLEKMLPEIDRTTQLVQEIASASNEQNNGANQVNNAMQQLNDATQRNAASSEELATNAEELASQSEQLREIMEFFNIGRASSRKYQPKSTPTQETSNEEVTTEAPLVTLSENTNNTSSGDYISF